MSNEQQAQEPVAWVDLKIGDEILPGDRIFSSGMWTFWGPFEGEIVTKHTFPVQRRYTAPPLRDLSDEEIKRVFGMCCIPQTNSLTWLVQECIKAAREPK